ncbi:DUF3895 domain-containing protein [Bacillus cereus]|uniref:DUF3895 domain-containing protein n=1 Tax=Bacillus cereus (strain VD146) TaxID=1053236 RepID=R8ME63_BACCX|nr:DUF3895 domain-containing protein [Bacillus cereus]EOP32334.1 hypothetical protein IK1_05870 [Bacillus cereus VD146]
MKTVYLSQNERDLLLNDLSSEQRTYLADFLKRGKKTAFASILAQQKGANSKGESDHISTQWTLLDFIDAGKVTDTLKCECGRSLRYQYIVKNLNTGLTLRFGKNHFQEHTNIPSDIVKEVINGMLQIDYELDEILVKLKNNWSLELNEGIKLPVDLELPQDIKEHLELHLPLLEKQLHRLILHIDKREKISSNMKNKDVTSSSSNKDEQISLFEEGTSDNKNKEEFYSNLEHKQFFHEYLEASEKEFINNYLKSNEIISTRLLCELLIKNINSYNKRYSSGKPHIYAYVSSYLDHLYNEGVLSVAENFDFKDRIYFSALAA